MINGVGQDCGLGGIQNLGWSAHAALLGASGCGVMNALFPTEAKRLSAISDRIQHTDGMPVEGALLTPMLNRKEASIYLLDRMLQLKHSRSHDRGIVEATSRFSLISATLVH